MARFKIHAGAEFDMLTQRELEETLARQQVNWRMEVQRGIRWRRFSAFADVSGAGAVVLGDKDTELIGPPEGFVWMLKRVSVTGYDPTTAALALYQGSASGSAVIHPKLAVYNAMEEVLYAGDHLVMSGTATANARVWVTGLVKEAPQALAWKL